MIWVCLTIFESFLVILTLISSIFFLYLIILTRALHFYCRIYLFMLSISNFLITSYSLSIFEYLNAGKQYALLVDGVSERSKFWEFLHEFGLGLESISMFFFSLERLFANCYYITYRKSIFKFFIFLSLLTSAIFSFGFSFSIHYYDILMPPTFLISAVDLIGLLILISTWQKSQKYYHTTVGLVPLSRRFQMSQVYSWTATLLPAAAGGLIFKIFAIIPIWVWLIYELEDADYGFANFLYNNILNIYIVILPWIILARNSKLKALTFRNSKISVIPRPVRTLEGIEIKMLSSQEDHFEELKRCWK